MTLEDAIAADAQAERAGRVPMREMEPRPDHATNARSREDDPPLGRGTCRRIHLACHVALALLLGGLAQTAGAVADRESQTQRLARTIVLPAEVRADDWIVLQLDGRVLANSAPDRADLRVVDAEGGLVPFRLRRLDPLEIRWTPIDTLALAWRPDPSAGWRSEISWTALPDRAILVVGEPHAQLESADPELGIPVVEWQSLAPEQSGFVLAEGDFRGFLAVFGGSAPASATAVIYEESRTPRPLEELAFTVTEGRFDGRSWRTQVVLDGPPRAVAALDLAPGARSDLPLTVEADVEGQGWIWASPSQPDRFTRRPLTHAPGEAHERLEWTPEHRAARLRLRAEGASGPEAPVTIRAVHAVPEEIEFRPRGAAPFRLLHGDPFLAAPGFASIPEEQFVGTRIRARLGAEEPNPFAEPPRGLEWLRRHPAVLTAGLFALLALLAAAVLLGRRSAPEATRAGADGRRPTQPEAPQTNPTGETKP